MRDLLLVTLFALVIPLAFFRPVWGALAWAWVGVMVPAGLAWGFAAKLPFAWAVGAATAAGALFSSDPKRLKGGAATLVLLIFIAYMIFTTFFALMPERAWPMLERALKVQIGTFLLLLLLYRKEHVLALIWVIAISIGVIAAKGGLFTIATLGQSRVYGPGGFIGDNNAFALATVISIPLWAYLYTQHKDNKWLKLGIAMAISLSFISAVGSQSRGAVLAIAAMATFLWFKSHAKVSIGVLLIIATIGIVAFMPEQWESRLATILNPRAESSANSRLETWTTLWNLAVDRPFTGGGFETYEKWIVNKYNPSYEGVFTAHSIYFQVLGEHGFVALFLYLLFWALVWRMCSQVASIAKGHAEQAWAFWLAQMIQVSIVAFLVGGAFLNLAYWDLPYYLFVAIAVTRMVIMQSRAKEVRPDAQELADGKVLGPSLPETIR